MQKKKLPFHAENFMRTFFVCACHLSYRGGVVRTQSLPKESQKFVSEMATLQVSAYDNSSSVRHR